MVIRTLWPGATAEEVARQVTDRIEKKLLETGEYEFIRSHPRPGEPQITFKAADAVRSAELHELWYQLRKKNGDTRNQSPPGLPGPLLHQHSADTLGNHYAQT